MWLPKKLYELLPVMYVTVGVLLVSGAFYIGVGHGLMLGYAALGTSCIMAGIFIKHMRRKARSRPEQSPAS